MHGLSIADMVLGGRRSRSSSQPTQEAEPSLISTASPSEPPEGATEVDMSDSAVEVG